MFYGSMCGPSHNFWNQWHGQLMGGRYKKISASLISSKKFSVALLFFCKVSCNFSFISYKIWRKKEQRVPKSPLCFNQNCIIRLVGAFLTLTVHLHHRCFPLLKPKFLTLSECLKKFKISCMIYYWPKVLQCGNKSKELQPTWSIKIPLHSKLHTHKHTRTNPINGVKLCLRLP